VTNLCNARRRLLKSPKLPVAKELQRRAWPLRVGHWFGQGKDLKAERFKKPRKSKSTELIPSI
jgi:hypothetical protein